MADYEHGSMDITEQERTFEAFVTWTVRVVFAIIVGLVLLAIFNG
jgi:hypothetical protein